MSVLAALNRAYERLREQSAVPAFGYSTQQIGFLISLNDDGSPAGMPVDLREGEGKKKTARPIPVPQPAKRTSGIAPNFLWDKTSYVLGVTAGAGKRLAQEHEAFTQLHEQLLAGTEDAGLLALLRFLRQWRAADFDRLGWPEEMKDQNVIFALERERRSNIYIHNRPAAQAILAQLLADKEGGEAVCLVSGEQAPVARLHPPVKGVWGAQSSGASLVSFNLDAFTSYGHEQGDNAPVSEYAAAAYTAALNKFLERGSRNRIHIGDASTVFWAEGPQTHLAEAVFSAMHGDQPASGFKINEESEAKKVGDILEAIRTGNPLVEVAPELHAGVRFYVLGLAPNAARLSIRFWLEDDFGNLVRNYQRFLSDMKLDDEKDYQSWSFPRLLIETIPLSERDRSLAKTKWLSVIKRLPEGTTKQLSKLGRDWLCAVLGGTNYPLTLMSTILMRLRADKQVNALRVAMLKAVLVRNFGKTKEAPVALDPDNDSTAYQLGRLFAVLERFQELALGDLNRTIRDGYFGTAMTTPAVVFPRLLKLNNHHTRKAAQQNPKLAGYFSGQLAEIMDKIPTVLPATLSNTDQGTFVIGYHHQLFRRKAESTTNTKEVGA